MGRFITDRGNRFHVTGGKGINTDMGWGIYCEKGFTMGVACDESVGIALENEVLPEVGQIWEQKSGNIAPGHRAVVCNVKEGRTVTLKDNTPLNGSSALVIGGWTSSFRDFLKDWRPVIATKDSAD